MKKPLYVGIAVVVAVWAANLASAELFGYPFAYCWARPLAPLFAPIFQLLFWGALVVFIWSLFVKNGKGTLAAMGGFFLFGGLPIFLGTLFADFAGC